MIAASRQYNVTLMEAMKPTLTPNFRAVSENLHKLGTIRRYFSAIASIPHVMTSSGKGSY